MSFDTIKPKRFVKIKRRHYNDDSLFVPQDVELRPSKKYTSTKRLAASTFLFMALQMLSPFGMFADTTPPTTMTPADNSVDVPRDSNIDVVFGQTPVNGQELLVSLKKYDGTPIATSNTLAGNTVTINPDAFLDYSTQYYVFINPALLVDTSIRFDATGALWGNEEMANHEFTTEADPATIPPVWANGYPKADTATATGFTVKVETNELARYYYAVVANNAAAPTAENVKAGTDPGFLASGNTGLSYFLPNTEYSTILDTLDDGVAYDVYVLAEDADGNQTFSNKIDVTTLDVTAPVTVAVSTNRVSNTQGTVVFSSDEAGEYYYGIVNKDASAPSINTSGAGVATVQGENTITATLTTGAKDVYVVVKDASGNLSTPLKNTVNAMTYTVTFDSNGGSNVSNQTIAHDAKVVEPVDPTKVGFAFVAWFSDNVLTTLWDFTNDVVTAPLTLFADWLDTEDPVVSLTAPTADTNVTNGSVTLTATATDNVGVTKVEFYKNNVKIGTDTTAPYSIVLNTLVLTNGNYSLTAKAYDEYNVGVSAAVNITVTNPDITSADNEIEKEGAKIAFTTMPSNLGGGFDVAVNKIALGDRVNPVGKVYSIIYSITPSKTLNGSYSATITLNYPSGRVWKEGDTVMYWTGNSWSSEGVAVTSHTENSITFTTNHFTDFGVFGNSTSGNGATELPRTGISTMLIAKIALNLVLSIAFVLAIARVSRKSKFGFILN